MRSTKLAPFRESWEKNFPRTIASEWARAAVDSLRLSRSAGSCRRARALFSTHRVARTSTRLLASDPVASAPPHASEADALGTLKTRMARAAIAPAARLENRITQLESVWRVRPLGVG